MASGPLEISVEERPGAGSGVAIVKPLGEIDLANADDLAGSLRSIRADEARGIVLDLRDVPFMDSSGLRVVLMAHGELGARLAVVTKDESAVARLLDLAELTERLHVFQTDEEAVAAVRAEVVDGA
jgi:anti-anti-sigma factor